MINRELIKKLSTLPEDLDVLMYSKQIGGIRNIITVRKEEFKQDEYFIEIETE